MSFIGLYVLYLLALYLTKSKAKAFLALFFAALAPNYIFYQGGFLPTIPSISMTILALYYFVRHYYEGTGKWWNYTIVFMTLAVLPRSTYAIPFLAIFGFEFIRVLRGRSAWKPKLPAVVLSFLLIGLSLWYNATVRETYGSDFLSSLLPSESWEQLKEVIRHMYENWRFSYLTYKHYLTLLLVVMLALTAIIWNRLKKRGNANQLWYLAGLWILGELCFWVVMNQQFIAHDYYFLDTFFLPLILIFILCLQALPNPENKWLKGVIPAFTVVFVLFTWKETSNFQRDRQVIDPQDTITGTLINYSGSEEWLDQNHIPKDAKILAMHAYGPNIPFVMMNRIGYACKGYEDKALFEEALSWKWDYVIFQKPYFIKDVYAFYPEILKKVEPVCSNENLLVCKRAKDTTKSRNLLAFMGFHKMVTTFRENFEQDSLITNNVQRIPDSVNDTNHLGLIEKKELYGAVLDCSAAYRKGKAIAIKVQLKCRLNEAGSLPLIFELDEGKEVKYYTGIDLLYEDSDRNKLRERDGFIILPATKLKNPRLIFYVFNQGGRRIELEDLKLTCMVN